MDEPQLPDDPSEIDVVTWTDVRDRAREASDKIEGLEADLGNAVKVAYNRGAIEWAKLNYPTLVADWEEADKQKLGRQSDHSKEQSEMNEMRKHWIELPAPLRLAFVSAGLVVLAIWIHADFVSALLTGGILGLLIALIWALSRGASRTFDI